jgi:7-cyano-7-deazaguanine synthase
MAEKHLVLFSGGLDSTALLWRISDFYNPENTIALSFNYGQRHGVELVAAKTLAKTRGVQHTIVNIEKIGRMLRSSQTTPGIEVPEGHYADENMKVTVVPNRNMIMLSIAAGIALSNNCEKIYTAVHAGDHFIYPDCRPTFIDAFNRAVRAGTDSNLHVGAPFIEWSKSMIVEDGDERHVPWQLTWSCYKGQALHCGRCGTCVERKEAFERAHVTDPTRYAD